jgi:hypothetical protein
MREVPRILPILGRIRGRRPTFLPSFLSVFVVQKSFPSCLSEQLTRTDFWPTSTSCVSLIRVENAAIRLVPRIEKRAWTRLRVACIGSYTSVLDLHGQTVLPGLIDINTHAAEWMARRFRNNVDLSDPKMRSIEDVAKAIAAVVASSP